MTSKVIGGKIGGNAKLNSQSFHLLNSTRIKNLKPKAKPYKVADAHGLYIDVRPTGAKFWRQKYRYNGKEKLLSHGKYPTVTLAEARALRDSAIKNLSDSIDPAALKKELKAQKLNTFSELAFEWHEKQSVNWQHNHSKKVWHQLSTDILPSLGNHPISEITATQLLNTLRKVEQRGSYDIASRLRQRCEGIFKHAILSERATNNPATQLIGVLKTKKVKHRNALDSKELPTFLAKLESTTSNEIVKLAMKILIHTFVRTGELRYATWDELNLTDNLWLIPGHRMKMDSDHIVPLTPQVIELFEKMRDINGNREYIFASPQRPRQPISENAILSLIYRMGYKGRATGHGFRATASTTLNEMGFNPDAIERQLAHAERNKVRAAYNRSEYLTDRTQFMTVWSDFVSTQSADIIPIRAQL